jgi:hypothetical protein
MGSFQHQKDAKYNPKNVEKCQAGGKDIIHDSKAVWFIDAACSSFVHHTPD